MSIHVPKAAAEVPVRMSDGATIILRRHGDPHGPRLAFSHGNGLAIDIYAEFWTQFLGANDVVVFDMRNHGSNPLHTKAGHTWERCTQDMTEIKERIAAAFGEKPIAGIFHSLSSIATLHAVRAGDRGWSQLVLFDPPMYPPPETGLRETMNARIDSMVQRARNRPESYGRWEEFADQLKANPRFTTWPSGTHELFAHACLRNNHETGRFDLACPRDFEAHIFNTNRDDGVYRFLAEGRTGVPVSIIGADPDFDDDMPPKVCARLARDSEIDYEFLSGTTHFLQLEKPKSCFEAVARRLQAAAVGA